MSEIRNAATTQVDLGLLECSKVLAWFAEMENCTYLVKKDGVGFRLDWIGIQVKAQKETMIPVLITVDRRAAATICKEKYDEINSLLGFHGPAPETESSSLWAV